MVHVTDESVSTDTVIRGCIRVLSELNVDISIVRVLLSEQFLGMWGDRNTKIQVDVN